MAALSSTFIILSAIIENMLYIHQPPNAIEVYICFNKQNDTWPHHWNRMLPHTSFGTSTFATLLPDTATEYKLRIIYQKRSVGDSTWQHLKCRNDTEIVTSQPTDKSQPPPPPEPVLDVQTVTALLYYITVCSSVLISKFVFKRLHERYGYRS